MTEYERGVFEPAERVRVFDGSEDDEDVEGSRLPVLIVIALVVLVAFAGVVWLAYEKGVASGRNEPRIAAVDSNGQPAAQYKGLKIYEQPAPNDADVVTTAPTPPKTNDTAVPQVAASAPAPDLRAPIADANSAKPAATPSRPDTTKSVAVATLPKKTVAEAKPNPSPVAQQEEPSTVPSTKSAYLLQIGSYKSEQEAADAWSAAKAAHASVLEGLSPDVKKVDLGDKGTWFRLRVAPFADKTAANALCDKLKAEGGTCILAR
jgi:cell division septation protein DedD